jgi:hypothetical protein
MIVRKFGWGWLVLGLVLGLGLFAFDGKAAAQAAYEGDRVCRACHLFDKKYTDYKQHGHAWMEIPTGGRQPGADLFGFASVGVGLPDPTAAGMTWA